MARPTQATFPDGSIFASDAAQIDQPDERWAAAYEGGEGKTPPAAGVHNYEFNRLDVFGQHLEKNGMADWDARTIYPLNGWAKGSDGMLYRSRLNGNVGNNPVGGDGTKWRSARSIFNEGVYEVGSVVFRPTNPGIAESAGGLGFGAWSRISGRVLIGAGTASDSRGESKTFTTGQTAGEYNHQLTTSEMPSHRHKISLLTTDDGGYSGGPKFAGSNQSLYDSPVFTDTTGGDAAHNNMQPYRVVDIWIRTA